MAAWAPMGFYGGGLAQCVDIGTVSPSTGKLYIGTDTQGFMFDPGSATLGNNISSRNVGLGASANYNQVACILSSVLAPGTTYMGTGDGLLKSTDDGLHWTPVNTSVTWAANGANPADPIPSLNWQRPVGRLLMEDAAGASQYLWVATYKQGIKRSPDGGATFPVTANMNSSAPGSNYYARALAQDPDQTTTCYAGFIEHSDTGGSRGFGGFWKCTNAHATTTTPNFVKQAGLPVAVVEDIKVLGGIIYVACGTDGVYLADKTADLSLSASWVNIGTAGGTTPGPVLNAASIWMSLDVVDDGAGNHLVLVACSNPGDTAKTCVAKITVVKATKAVSARANLATSSTVTTATVSPGGQTWWNDGTNYKLGASNWQNPQVMFDPGDGTHQKMYVVGVSGFYRSVNGGTSWFLASGGMRMFLGRCLATDPNTAGWGAVGSSDWGVLFWKDGVAASASTSVAGGSGIPGSTQTFAIAVDPLDSTVYLGLGNKYGRAPTAGQVMQGAGGATWPPGPFTNVAGTPSWATATGSKSPMGLATLRDGSGNKVLLAVAAQGGGLWRNVTSGGTFQGWAQVGAATAVGTSTLNPPGANYRFDTGPGRAGQPPVVYCFDPKTGVYASTDYGVTWSTVSTAYTSGSANSSELAAHPLNPGEVWISYNGSLRKFANADGVGALGNTLVTTLPNCGAIKFRPTDGLLAATTTDTGTGQLAWQSTDGGGTWAGLGGAEFGQLDNTTEHLRWDQAGVTGRLYASGSNIAETLGAGAGTGSAFTLVQQSNNLVGGAGTLSVWFSGTSVASTAQSMLVQRIVTDDCAQAFTAPAGWELVFDAPSGTTTGQARVLEYVYRNNPGSLYGSLATAAAFTYSNAASNTRGKLHEWSTPASTFQYADRVAVNGALAAATSLGPLSPGAALRVNGGLAQSVVGTLFSAAPANTWPAATGWANDGTLANAVLDYAMKDQNPTAGTVSLTDSISTSVNMTSWAGGLGTFWASPVHVTTASVPAANVGTAYNAVLAAAGGTPFTTGTGTKVGLTVPTSAFSTGCFAQLNGWATMAVADAACVAKVSRYGPGNHPPVTKKFWFTGANAWNTALNELSTYRANGTYVIFCMQPTVGLDADYPLGSDYSAGGPVAAAATADKTSLASFLTTIAGMGFTATNSEIVLWQEPGNNISLQQWNNMLRTYGPVVNAPHGGVTFKLCINIQGHTGSANPTWCKAAMGIGPTYGVGAAKAGLPRIDLMALDYYCSVYLAGVRPETVDSAGDSMVSLADAAGINFALNEVGANPSAQIPLPASHQTVANSTAYMHFIRDWTLGRQAAGVGPRTICWWTANCNADGTGQLSSPIGFNPEWTGTTDPRIPPFQEWVDLLSGATSYGWSVWSGTLPPGLSVSAGTITGTPTAAGTYAFRVLATDAAGNMGYSPPLTIVVSGGVTITTTSLPDGAVGELAAYSATLALTGGVAPFTWTQPSGTLPTGLSLSSGGVISGTATAEGVYTFDVQVTDANGSTSRTTLSITIQPQVAITTNTLPAAVVGTSYSFVLGAAGGLPDYAWAQPSGTLPDGIALDSVTGILAGTPTAAGAYAFQILVTDAGGGTDTVPLVLVVATPPAPASPVDSLVIAGQFELAAGGVVSDHPACPGAIFLVGKAGGDLSYDLGMPQPVTELLASLALDGERPTGRRASNRTVTLPVVIIVPPSGDPVADRSLLAAARETLWQAIDGDRWELTWARAGGLPVVFDCFRAAATTYNYSLVRDQQLVSDMDITFQALPYGRSNDLETVAFAAPSSNWPPPADPVTLDSFSSVSSANDPGQWARSTQAAVGSFSAHWSRRWRDRPHYTHGLAAPVNMGQRPKISFWVGLGTTPDQYHVWHGGKVTADIQLTDAGGTTVQLAATVKCACSGLPGQPSWTRVSAAMPLTTDFDTTAVASYSIKLWNTTDSSDGSRILQAECYLAGLEASAPAVGAPAQRGAVYQLRGIVGTARAPLNIQVQPGPATVQQVFLSDSPGSGNWPVPASTTVIKAEVWASGSGGGGGDGGSLGGGGGPGGEYACEPAMPVSPGASVAYTVGQPGSGGGVGQTGQPGNQSSITAGAHSVTASPGLGGIKGGSRSATGAKGGTGSAATVHFDGGDGGPAEPSGRSRSNGAGGGGSGGQFQAGRDGQVAGDKSPGSGGVAVSGGGPGGTGGTQGGPGGTPRQNPGGGGGGGDAQSAGGTGAPGRVKITYGVTAGIPLQALVVHRAGPDAPGTLQPLVSVSGTGSDVPDGSIEYPVVSYAPGVQPAFCGTYTVVAVAQSWSGSSSRTLTVGVKQYDGASGTPPASGVGRISANSVSRAFTPADAPNGMVVLGDITLPVRDLAPDQADASYTATVTDTNTGDRFYDVLLLDTEGSTVMLNGTAPGYANVFIDSPDANRALGPVLGSYTDRDAASSILDDTIVSGPPLSVEPGDNWVLVYAPTGVPAMFATYLPAWWADRLR